jgi:hypothetical protein
LDFGEGFGAIAGFEDAAMSTRPDAKLSTIFRMTEESSTMRTLSFSTVVLLSQLSYFPTAGLGLAATHRQEQTHTRYLHRQSGNGRLAAAGGF